MERHAIVAAIAIRTVKRFPIHGVLTEQQPSIQPRIPKRRQSDYSIKAVEGHHPKIAGFKNKNIG
jgi:hypothetical protein